MWFSSVLLIHHLVLPPYAGLSGSLSCVPFSRPVHQVTSMNALPPALANRTLYLVMLFSALCHTCALVKYVIGRRSPFYFVMRTIISQSIRISTCTLDPCNCELESLGA